MRISDRLTALYNAVSKGESVADIGTDHGYVPLLLLRNGISPRVILGDISNGSLSKARENFAANDMVIPEEDFRVGDGLAEILPGEVDAVIIGGLGGKTIIQILSDDMNKTRSFRKLILQPRNACGELRCFLYENGYDIVHESLSEEGKFVCEVITAVRTEEEHRTPPYGSSDVRWKYPEMFVSCDPTLLRKRIEWKTGALMDQIENLKQSQVDQSVRIAMLTEQRTYLISLLEKSRTEHGEEA